MGNSASSANSSANVTPTIPTLRAKVATHSARPSIDDSPRAARRRRKSIELSDVDHNFKSSRKQPPRIAQLEDDDNAEGALGGSLRGALQGRADHVVYGPRRIDGIAPGTPGLSSVSAAASVASSPVTTNRYSPPSSNSTRFSNSRPHTILLPSSALHNSTQFTDPDDTTHPGYKASPRLTSSVLLSQDRMPVIVSPIAEQLPSGSPFDDSHLRARHPKTSANARTGIFTPSLLSTGASTPGALLPPNSSAPFPPVDLPSETIFAHSQHDGESTAIERSTSIPMYSSTSTSPRIFLSPELPGSPASVTGIEIPFPSTPSSPSRSTSLLSVVDLGAGPEGVPTLIKWTDEDGQTDPSGVNGGALGPKQVFVTGTFAKGWKTKIELRKTNANEFSALISLPPGPHRLKFIVDKEWKASKHLPAATDADGNLINYVHVTGANHSSVVSPWIPTLLPGTSPSRGMAPWAPSLGRDLNESTDDLSWEAEESEWTQEIPAELIEWGEWEAERENYEVALESSAPPDLSFKLSPPPASSGVPPPSLPAQLEKGPLNHAAYVTQGSGDDNSILPKPDHSVINHLAASPIKGGFLSVGVTTRYKRKFVTIVYYKALNA